MLWHGGRVVCIGFPSWRTEPPLFPACLALISALDRDAQQPFCYASLRLKHGGGRDIDNVHEAIVRLDHRGSFLLWPCGKALRDHHKVPAYGQGPSRTPCGTRTRGASAYTQQARTPMYRARGAAILHAEEPSPRCGRSVPRVEGGVPRLRRGVCDALHRSTVLPHNGNCRGFTSSRSSGFTIASWACRWYDAVSSPAARSSPMVGSTAV